MFVIDEPRVCGAIKHKNRTTTWIPSCMKIRTQSSRQSQDSSVLVAIEAEWSRANILELIELVKDKTNNWLRALYTVK